MIEYRVQTLLANDEKSSAFLKHVEQLKSKRKGIVISDNTYVERNKYLAENWRAMSPKRRSALLRYTEAQHASATVRRS